MVDSSPRQTQEEEPATSYMVQRLDGATVRYVVRMGTTPAPRDRARKGKCRLHSAQYSTVRTSMLMWSQPAACMPFAIISVATSLINASLQLS